MTARELRWQPLLLAHGIPFLLGLAAYSAFWVFRGRGDLGGITAWCVRSPWAPVTLMFSAQIPAYVALMVRRLREYSRRIRDSYSTLDGINLRWLERRLGVFVAICAIGITVVGYFFNAVQHLII